MGFDFAGLVDWLIRAPWRRNPHIQSGPFSRFGTFWRLCDASWSPPLLPRSLQRSLASCLAALPLPHYRWSRNHGRSSAGLCCWVSALLSVVSWWYHTIWLAQGCVPLLRPFALLLALWSSVPSGSLLLHIAPSLRDGVTLPGRVWLSPQSQRRLFLHLPGAWSRAFAMRSPFWVESFLGLDRNEDSSRTFPGVLVPGLIDGVTFVESCCVFLRTRSDEGLFSPPILTYFAMGSPYRLSVVFLPTRSERSPLWIVGQSSLRMGSPFSGQVLATWSRVKEFLELGSWEHFSGLFSGWISSSFGRPVCSEVGEGPTFRCLRFGWGLCFSPLANKGVGLGPSSCTGPVASRPPLVDRSASAASRWFLSPGSFHVLVFHAWWLSSGTPRSQTSRDGLLAYCQDASESLPLPGVRSLLLFFGIAVWTLLQATPLPRSMESSPKPGQGLSVSAFMGCSSALNASPSEVAGSHVLLSNYVTRVLSHGPGIFSSFCHPSWVVSLVLQNLIGAPWSSYGRTESVFFWFWKRSSSWPLPRLGFLVCSTLCHSVAFIPGLGWSVLFFRPGLRGEESGPLLPCSSVCGLHFTGPTKRETIAMGDCYILCGRSGLTWPLGCASSAMRAVPFLPQGVARRSYRRPLAPDAVVTGVSALSSGTVCFVSLEFGALVLSLHLFFEKNFAVIPVRGWGCGTRARPCGLLLRGSCPLVPCRLPPVLCGGCAGPGFIRACSPRHITAY